ncbi:MAG TPA: iron-sulfur cluster assembly scaffold protein [Capsulimonadaceae bacterium]|jgi:YD repeat-containing protein
MPPTGPATALDYDASGNMVSMTTDGVATLLAWNGEGRLSSLTQPTGAEERYAYDPAGIRRVKRAPGGSTLYVPDGVNVLLELDAETGEPIAWYTNAPANAADTNWMPWMYNETVKDHFTHPRGMGNLANPTLAGKAGEAGRGYWLRLSLAVDDGRISSSPVNFYTNSTEFGSGSAWGRTRVDDCRQLTAVPEARKGVTSRSSAHLGSAWSFQAFGCPALIASGSMFVETIRGMSIKRAERVTSGEIVARLGGLPADKPDLALLPVAEFRKALSKGTASEARKLVATCNLAPGDIIMLTGAVRELHMTHPGKFVTDVRTPCGHLWENNPYVTPLRESDETVEAIQCEYPLINSSNHAPYHFVHGFRKFLSEKLGVPIEPHGFKGHIVLSDTEKGWISQVEEITGELPTRFWIIVSGGKTDYTAKWWDPDRCQAVEDHFKDVGTTPSVRYRDVFA